MRLERICTLMQKHGRRQLGKKKTVNAQRSKKPVQPQYKLQKLNM